MDQHQYQLSKHIENNVELLNDSLNSAILFYSKGFITSKERIKITGKIKKYYSRKELEIREAFNTPIQNS